MRHQFVTRGTKLLLLVSFRLTNFGIKVQSIDLQADSKIIDVKIVYRASQKIQSICTAQGEAKVKTIKAKMSKAEPILELISTRGN